jgi:hypothetical protein
VGSRYRRPSRDAANDGNLDFSTLVPGRVVANQFGSARWDALSRHWWDMELVDRDLTEPENYARLRVYQVASHGAWIKEQVINAHERLPRTKAHTSDGPKR